ncbi:hypothetical protein [Bifidobacterium biavatii]|uniref:Uncharacterized protein n=1 Tax=Bifidobacterium biavatii DSM 23969 TaxID=1437608 RepID=A0A086ZHX4_9BIFI|nr:hypothetical protein [Bifidobacterium biavatii]KFI46124.1 hypothetical protein BBIA_2089 [Bifidobacterium biavatii DSM 23969]
MTTITSLRFKLANSEADVFARDDAGHTSNGETAPFYTARRVTRHRRTVIVCEGINTDGAPTDERFTLDERTFAAWTNADRRADYRFALTALTRQAMR